MSTQTTGSMIVIGVEESRYAELTGARVHTLIAWHPPEIFGYTPRSFAGARQILMQPWPLADCCCGYGR